MLVLQDDHSSAVLEWMTRASAEGFTVETVRRPGGRRLDGRGARRDRAAGRRAARARVDLVGALVGRRRGRSCARRAGAARAQGAALLIDATHSVGVTELDVRALDPDFVVFPTYKWLLGPYGRAFLYVAKRHQGGIPLEQTSYGRRGVRAEQEVYFADTDYVADARRFDMGERDHFISMEMASIGMEMMAEWGSPAIVERLAC